MNKKLLCVISSILIILVVGFMVWGIDTYSITFAMEQTSSQNSEITLDSIPEPTPEPTLEPTPEPTPEPTFRPIQNPPSSVTIESSIGRLTCNRVGLSVNLVYSDSQETLGRENTAIVQPWKSLPWNGPALIADHNTQDFDALYDMVLGDEIIIETDWGDLCYVVEYVGHGTCTTNYSTCVTDSGVDILSTQESLALYTCYPRHSKATSLDRLIILATLK